VKQGLARNARPIINVGAITSPPEGGIK